MKIIALLFILAVSVVLADNPVQPTCPYAACYYFWVANLVPSTAATQFDFFFNEMPIATAVNYGAKEVVAVYCNATAVNFYPTLALGSTLVGPQAQSTPNDLACGFMYAFFATRKPNVNNAEVYGIGYRMIAGSPGYMSGFIFNGIYRGGQNGVNSAFCSKNSATCDTNNQNQRTNQPVPINTWTEMQLKMPTGFENPVTITGPNGQTLFSDVVTGTVDTYQAFYFFGDNQDQTDFPLNGGISPASILTISMALLVSLSAVVSAML